MRAIKGILIECDPTVKQVILNLSDRDRFLIQDLDDQHLFIDATWLDRIRYEVEQLLDENTYKLDVAT
ncbi:uncharacterized protein VTP21DRAFT_5366 [Calcarisporiella thermophila]|uniref:uncharacterized protein n=1 Tax=Calcarisporiella thermophila TaxID=911321 RepID=UPI003742ACD4